jgi:ABC-type branched-subunit amino acid transport system ATPase component
MSPLLEAKAVTKLFGGLAAVSNVDVSVSGGEILGIVGPNGAGKSTLFNAISGVDPPTSGIIRFKGRDITRSSTPQIARMGLIRTFQRSLPFTDLSVVDNLLVGQYAFMQGALVAVQRWTGLAYDEREDRARAANLLELVGLWPQRNLNAGALSQGDQRRLEVARALMSRPALVMFDEPAAGLSESEMHGLVDVLLELRQLGQAFVVIEHHLPMIMRLCDRVVVLNYGEKIAEGKPSVIRTDPVVAEAYLGKRRAHA